MSLVVLSEFDILIVKKRSCRTQIIEKGQVYNGIGSLGYLMIWNCALAWYG